MIESQEWTGCPDDSCLGAMHMLGSEADKEEPGKGIRSAGRRQRFPGV